MQLTDLNIGILFVLAISSVGVYGVALGGWASNNKYSLLGGLRSSAQMISYELPLALAIAAPLLLANTLSFREMVNYQSGYWLGFIPRWNVFPEIVGFIVFLIAGVRRNQSRSVRSAGSRKRTGGRLPHRIQQHEFRGVLHGRIRQHGDRHRGRHAAVSGRMAAAVSGALLRLRSHPGFRDRRTDRALSRPASGAPHGQIHAAGHRRWCSSESPRCSASRFFVPVLKTILMALFWFCGKVGILLFLFIWVRATLPRFRYDQLMRFAWILLFPLAMVNLLATGLVVALTSK